MLPQTPDVAPPKIIRRIRGYAIEWNHRYSFGAHAEDHSRKFSFLPGAFDACLARKPDIALSKDLDGVTRFASTGDGTLKLSSDDVGLLVEATLLDSPQNRELIRLIDTGRVKGWSHAWSQILGGCRSRTENGVQLFDHHRAVLRELTLVVRKVPRAKIRRTPIFLPLQ